MTSSLSFQNSKDILRHFETLDIADGDSFELELLESLVQKIGYKAFVDLAQIFSMKMLTPTIKQDKIVLKFYKLNKSSSFHKAQQNSEKYGVDSEFFTIDKTLQFSFLYHYQQALKFIDIKNKNRVLNLGINRGDEIVVINEILDNKDLVTKKFIGIDYCKSAIKEAEKEFSSSQHAKFICHDINNLDELNLEKFDLIISIGTLQSSSISFNQTFMDIYQNLLAKDGAIILGFPNCRWIDGEMIYGALAPNYAFSELSLVLKDIHFCKKYLQQKGYRVVITGKDYLFLTARKIIKQ